MEINPNRSLKDLNRAKRKGGVSKSSEDISTGEAKELKEDKFHSAIPEIEEALKALPEERPEMIETGIKLARDPAYPNRQELNQVGKLLIRNELNPEDPEQ